MNQEELGGVVRAVIAPLVAYAAGKGWIGADSVALVVTAIAAVATAVWSVVAKRKTA